jgi:transcription elongation factor GreA
VIEPVDGEPDQRVRFGTFVTVTDEESGEDKTYRIVGDLEADIEQGMISLSSPLARALLGKRIGDLVEVRVPKGTVEYSVTEIRAR